MYGYKGACIISELLGINFTIFLQVKRNLVEWRCCSVWLSSALHWSQALQDGWMNGTNLYLFSAYLNSTSAVWIVSTATIEKTDVGTMGKLLFLFVVNVVLKMCKIVFVLNWTWLLIKRISHWDKKEMLIHQQELIQLLLKNDAVALENICNQWFIFTHILNMMNELILKWQKWYWDKSYIEFSCSYV